MATDGQDPASFAGWIIEENSFAVASFFVEGDEVLSLISALLQNASPQNVHRPPSEPESWTADDEQRLKRICYVVRVPCLSFHSAPLHVASWVLHVDEPAARRVFPQLDRYQEQPQLLDAYLERMIDPVISTLRSRIGEAYTGTSESTSFPVLPRRLHPYFRFLYQLTKVRGYKTVGTTFALLECFILVDAAAFGVLISSKHILVTRETVKFFSHEVSDLEPMLDFLRDAGHNAGDVSLWETRYVVLLWLSLICRIPFDLRRVDSGAAGGETPLVDRIVALVRPYLFAVGKEYEGAALLMMRLLTSQTDAPFVKNNALLRKLLVKLTQRLGLCYMKPRVAAWRYQRGNRSLVKNLGGENPAKTAVTLPAETLTEEDMDDEEVPEEMDEIVEILLNGLRDKDTIVRWSAAKGIGRIANRLPRDLAQEVVASVLSLLEEDTFPSAMGDGTDYSQVSDSTWHGACLAMAELARRGLLLPERLLESIPWVIRALKFDQRRGAHSIGIHVRDAACYVCWSFARAYDPEIVKPFMGEVGRTLVVVSVCDREVNVRRASSAAFQENVGRQGIFPHGIDIVTTADYFAIGNRAHAFLDVAVEIAKFDEYRRPIFDHIANVSVVHWDQSMRELASKTLGRLAPLDLEYALGSVLKKMIPLGASDDLVVRHGVMLAIGEICLAWSKARGREKGQAEEWWTAEEFETLIVPISTLLTTFPTTYLETFGSDITRLAYLHLTACLATSRWPLHIPSLPQFTSSLWHITNTSLDRREENVQESAATAVRALSGWSGVPKGVVE
ncbi:hypothetical protein HK104_003260, partial [Borealophlyctis nickersoniae]